MKVLALKRLQDARERYPGAAYALESWLHIMRQTDFGSLEALRNTFAHVENNGKSFGFKVPGTSLSLTANINFPAKIAVIQDIKPNGFRS